MSGLALRVEGLGKRFRINVRRESYATLRDTLARAAWEPVHWLRSLLGNGSPRSRAELVWALKNVSFTIQPGEVVGIIGRNGAGKSTLLKILSRITAPTEGEADIYGRVGSLLEVGTGFHPELSGRENVFLNGAILGMGKAEIARKFDEIVDFAEVEKFIDTPVKHYSSGMYLRLAFAVAAHLEPEILLVDEVLAVGDAAFQRKCLGKMQEVGAEGRTVLFVSHNMPAITRLCPRTIMLGAGEVAADGPSHQVVGQYLHSDLGTTAAREWPDLKTAPGGEIVRLRAVRVTTEDGQTTEAVDIRRPVGIEMEYEVLRPGYSLLPHFTVHNSEGIHLFVGTDWDAEWRGRPRPTGRYRSTGWIPGNLMAEGTFIVGPAMRTINPDILHFYEADAVAFQICDVPDADTARGDWSKGIPGVIRPLLRWTTAVLDNAEDSDLALPKEAIR